MDPYLFVYGSLRKAAEHPQHNLLERHAKFIGESRFRGKLFMVKNYPGAVKSDNPDDRVTGEVYLLNRPEKVLGELDPYEGYEPGRPGKSLFIRSREEVTLLESGELIKAWIYLYNRPVGQLTSISSGEYLKQDRANRRNL